ncbi:MAG: glycoside hydrolase family 95 protein, partial [Tannerella sp.]|nr:glycoside hydrolase family 95 protein [Tannerella sp.]
MGYLTKKRRNRNYNFWFMISFCLLAANYVSGAKLPESKLVLWYRQPAADWMTSALPIGNGRLGAMVFGGVKEEHIQFNDKTLWTGSTEERGAYQNFGDIFINFEGHDEYNDYIRFLDIEKAIAGISYRSGG